MAHHGVPGVTVVDATGADVARAATEAAINIASTAPAVPVAAPPVVSVTPAVNAFHPSSMLGVHADSHPSTLVSDGHGEMSHASTAASAVRSLATLRMDQPTFTTMGVHGADRSRMAPVSSAAAAVAALANEINATNAIGVSVGDLGMVQPGSIVAAGGMGRAGSLVQPGGAVTVSAVPVSAVSAGMPVDTSVTVAASATMPDDSGELRAQKRARSPSSRGRGRGKRGGKAQKWKGKYYMSQRCRYSDEAGNRCDLRVRYRGFCYTHGGRGPSDYCQFVFPDGKRCQQCAVSQGFCRYHRQEKRVTCRYSLDTGERCPNDVVVGRFCVEHSSLAQTSHSAKDAPRLCRYKEMPHGPSCTRLAVGLGLCEEHGGLEKINYGCKVLLEDDVVCGNVPAFRGKCYQHGGRRPKRSGKSDAQEAEARAQALALVEATAGAVAVAPPALSASQVPAGGVGAPVAVEPVPVCMYTLPDAPGSDPCGQAAVRGTDRCAAHMVDVGGPPSGATIISQPATMVTSNRPSV